MAYKQVVANHQLNFQINRVLTHGEEAGKESEIWEIAPFLGEYNPELWFRKWHELALRAESEGRTMHAAYYHRMAEFLLPDGSPEKAKAYGDFRADFYQAIQGEKHELHDVPYEGATLPALVVRAENERGIVVLHGGFDSFVEEFYITLRRFLSHGDTVIAFEGPGQGRPLSQGLKFIPEWEKPVSAVLDYFELDQVTLVGVSMGGYLALRAAAFEPRIARVVLYNIIWSLFGVMTHLIPEPLRNQLTDLIMGGKKAEVNAIIGEIRRADGTVDWAFTHGMYTTGKETPYDHLRYWLEFSTWGFSHLVKQDVLLTAGESDHYVPLEYFYLQKEALVNARSLKGRIFTAEEGGEQHCQVGNLDLAIDEILDWLDGFHAAP